jgi:hypothetical protein
MMRRNWAVVFAAALLLGVFVPEVVAQAEIHVHPGWLDSATQEGFDVADGWPTDPTFPWPSTITPEGYYTFGVNSPDSDPNYDDFWNYAPPSQLWILNLGAYLESKRVAYVTPEMPWLFVQFSYADMNSALAEISVKEESWDNWVTVGSYDNFGRGDNWVSIEGLEPGAYYVRITSKSNGRTVPPPQGACGNPAFAQKIARIGSTAPVPPEIIHLTGGGWLPITGGKANFSMDVSFNWGDDRPTGTFSYADHVLRASIQSTEMLGISESNGQAWIQFVGLTSSGTVHTVNVSLRPGRAGEGWMYIRISYPWSGCTPDWAYRQRVTLGGGQIKIH